MASSSYAKSLIGGLSADIRSAFARVFEFVLDGGIRFGAVDANARAENLGGVFLSSTTAASTGVEWSVPHGLGSAPRFVMQVMRPSVVNSRVIPDLQISRAADANRLYFVSPTSTGAVFYLYVE